MKKPAHVYIYQGDIGELASALESHLEVSPRSISEELYMFGSDLSLGEVQELLQKAERTFVVIEVRNYAAQGVGTPLLGALFQLF
ncbi:hypothetical protein [Pseudomonas prosekii]|uniref:hypothetical protein n=1 Tax=Pseudomonas prosekii TaxID=1148509 RepID=UPI003F75446E